MSLRFCPSCGGLLTWSHIQEERHQQPVCIQCGYILWQNPKPTVSALLVRRDRVAKTYEVLLVRRARPPRNGFWDCPGGFIDPDEHPETALQRELREELGVEAADPKFLGIYMDRYGQNGESTLNIYYWGTIRRGRLAPRSDVKEARWVRFSRLPKVFAFANNRRALNALRRVLTLSNP